MSLPSDIPGGVRVYEYGDGPVGARAGAVVGVDADCLAQNDNGSAQPVDGSPVVSHADRRTDIRGYM